MSDLSPKQKGNILETRFIELVALGSEGRLSSFTPDSDDDGIDIIVNRKGDFKPIFVQVNSRFNLDANGNYSKDIGTNTFRDNDKFFLCFFLYNIEDYDVEKIWFIPSKDFKKQAIEINPVEYKQKLRFSANPKDKSGDMWNQYKIEKKELAKKIEEEINKLYS
jgi:hypothetical protein